MKIYAHILCALLAGAAIAADISPVTPTATTLPAKIKSLYATGSVVSTDMVGNTITVKGKKKAQWIFAVPANAKITQGKKTVAFPDITTGSKVSVKYTKEGDTLTASSIKISEAKK